MRKGCFKAELGESVFSYDGTCIREDYITHGGLGRSFKRTRELELTDLQNDRLEHIRHYLLFNAGRNYEESFARFLCNVLGGGGNIAPFYDFTYVVTNKRIDYLIHAFLRKEDAVAYARNHENSELAEPPKHDGGIFEPCYWYVSFFEKPGNEGQLWVEECFVD